MTKVTNYLFAFFITVSFLFTGCSSNEEQHVGKWTSVDKTTGESGWIVLEKDGNAIIELGETKMGGESWMENSGVKMKVDVKYEIDYTKDPAWLDFTIYFKEAIPADESVKWTPEQKQAVEQRMAKMNENPMKLMKIIKFISGTQMEIQSNGSNPNVPRPDSFDKESENYSLLEKVDG
jgi:hypothetical protein